MLGRHTTNHDAIPRSLSADYSSKECLSDREIHGMYSLFSQYYDGTSYDEFICDLNTKTGAIILRDMKQQVKGFSTQEIREVSFLQKRYTIIFSGDTIVDHHYWGQQALNYEWLKFTGKVYREMTTEKLYWFLIVKGHRTYRYLQAFYRSFYPSITLESQFPAKELLDYLAREKFAENYCDESGLIIFPKAKSRLKKSWAIIPEKDIHRPNVKYFLQKNPDYKRGNELACLCELVPENHRSFAQRIFLGSGHAATLMDEKT